MSRLFPLVVMVGLLTGCFSSNKCKTDGECVGFNADGFSVCDEDLGQCLAVTCLQDEHCDIGSYCSDRNSCVPGCSTDADCQAGETCDPENHACIAYGCRTTELDCEIGESCNQATGVCEGSSTPHCKSCVQDTWDGSSDCPGNVRCVSYNDRPADTFCLFTCGTQADCPRGFDCIQALTGDSGNYCAGTCPVLWDLGAVDPNTGTTP